MPPRSDDPPRRGLEPRRGAARPVPQSTGDDDNETRGFGGIGDARAYTPRGRTVRENGERGRAPRTDRTGDPFRPALQVLDGGQPAVRDRRRTADEPPVPPARRGRGRDRDDAHDGDVRDDVAHPDDDGTDDHPDEIRREESRRGEARRDSRRGRADRYAGDRRDGDRHDNDRRDSDRYADGRFADDDRPVRGRPLRGRAAGDRAARERAAETGRRRGDDTGRDIGRRAAEPGRRGEPARRTAADPDGRRSASASRAGAARTSPSAGRTTAGRSTAGRTTAGRGAAGRGTADREAPPPPRRGSSAGGGRPPGPPRPTRPVGPHAEPPRLADSRRRLRLGTLVALALFTSIGVRLVSLQVIDSPAAAASILEQRQMRLLEVALPAPRGSIVDRDGEVLAHSIEARFVFADPTRVTDAAANAAALSPLLGVAASTLKAKMEPKKRPGGGASRFEYLARGVDITVAESITALNLPGIGVRRDERRSVPGADLAANLIGFTGGDLTGLEGLEARYDDLLRGRDGKRIFEIGSPYVDKGQLAKEIPGGFNREEAAQPGSSLALTIDRGLQFKVEQLLGADMKKVNATVGAAVVLDTHTGEVLAQASYPPWNAAQPFKVDDPSDREDVASSLIADPGSTHKAFIFGAALQEGIITPDSTLEVGPALRRGGFLFKDTHPHPKNTKVTMAGLMAYSSNVGTIRLGDKLGAQRVFDYQRKFGLGEATQEGMPGEAEGKVLTPDQWSPSGSGAIPIGHSVDATLIQMAAGYNVIANNGTYIQPHLIKETIAADGTRTPAPAPKTHPVLSPEHAAELRTIMESVVAVPGATGNLARVEGYRVAGKTGTGKRLINGKYTSHEAGSFIGMAPAENPRYVVAVFADTPGGGGGAVAGPTFSKIMAFTLIHNKVPPSGTKPPKFTILP
jgi:cell division protein FtsI (penicillin-binding protein 3)